VSFRYYAYLEAKRLFLSCETAFTMHGFSCCKWILLVQISCLSSWVAEFPHFFPVYFSWKFKLEIAFQRSKAVGVFVDIWIDLADTVSVQSPCNLPPKVAIANHNRDGHGGNPYMVDEMHLWERSVHRKSTWCFYHFFLVMELRLRGPSALGAPL